MCDVSDEIEEELAPLIEAQEVKVQETYEDQVNKARAASADLSWIHVLGMCECVCVCVSVYVCVCVCVCVCVYV